VLYNEIKGSDNMNDSKIIGEKIKSLRSQKNITQQTLAETLNVSPQAISKWENGDSYPDLEQIVSLSKYFKITTDELLKNNIDKEISEYPIYDLAENENLIVDITDIYIFQGISVSLSITNKTAKQISVNANNFLLVDSKGTAVKAKMQPITDYDGFTISHKPLHELPSFIPSYAKANIVLVYENSDVEVLKLWINIEDVFMNKVFIIKIPLIMQDKYKSDLKNISNEDKAYYFNYLIRYNKLEYRQFTLNPKINSEIIPLFRFPVDYEFIRKHLNIFEEETLKKLIHEKKYFDLNLVKKLFDLEEQKKIIKQNFDVIENQIMNHTNIFNTTAEDDFLDEDIIEKIIELTIIHTKSFKEWHYKYIDDDFYKNHKKVFENLDFRKSLNLFYTKMSNEIVNTIILEKQLGDFPLFKVVKLDEYFPNRIHQKTIDALVLRYDFNTIEDLVSIKGKVSDETYSEAKEKVFKKLELELKKKKDDF